MTVVFIILVEKNRGKFSLKEHCTKSFSLKCVPLVSFLYSGFNLQSCLFGIFHNNNLFWIATQVYTIHCYLQNNLLLGSGWFFFANCYYCIWDWFIDTGRLPKSTLYYPTAFRDTLSLNWCAHEQNRIMQIENSTFLDKNKVANTEFISSWKENAVGMEFNT